MPIDHQQVPVDHIYVNAMYLRLIAGPVLLALGVYSFKNFLKSAQPVVSNRRGLRAAFVALIFICYGAGMTVYSIYQICTQVIGTSATP